MEQRVPDLLVVDVLVSNDSVFFSRGLSLSWFDVVSLSATSVSFTIKPVKRE